LEVVAGGVHCGNIVAIEFSELDIQTHEVVETVLAIEISKNKQILHKFQLLTGGTSV
jgi:hypothetical protein